jgi:hypothetical protein
MDSMKPAKPTAATPRRAAKTPGKQAIICAVASSTAIETGQSIREIERTLRSTSGKFRDITLAR